MLKVTASDCSRQALNEVNSVIVLPALSLCSLPPFRPSGPPTVEVKSQATFSSPSPFGRRLCTANSSWFRFSRSSMRPRSDSRLLDFWERGGVIVREGESESSPGVKLAATSTRPGFLKLLLQPFSHF